MKHYTKAVQDALRATSAMPTHDESIPAFLKSVIHTESGFRVITNDSAQVSIDLTAWRLADHPQEMRQKLVAELLDAVVALQTASDADLTKLTEYQ